MSRRKKAIAKVEVDVTDRDFVLARLGVARTLLSGALAAVDEAIEHFIEPEDDDKGKERSELIESAVETTGAASRALEAAQEVLPQIDFEECEPWDDDADDEDEDEDGDEEGAS